jgi:ankyrin repeat protein
MARLFETRPSQSCVSPDEYLTKLLESRGYDARRMSALDCPGYRHKPTEKMVADYALDLVNAVRDARVDAIGELAAQGRGMDACNRFGESVMHLACRRGSTAVVRCLIERGGSLEVVDDFGRTPMHDACWTAEPCFELVTFLVSRNHRMLLHLDRRGSSPLCYVRKEHHGVWCAFLDFMKDALFPVQTTA